MTPNRARERDKCARVCIYKMNWGRLTSPRVKKPHKKKQLHEYPESGVSLALLWLTGRTTCLWTGSRCAGAVGGGMGRGWEKRLASVISHAPLCPSSRSSPLRSNPRFRSSLKRSRCANTSASECAARGLRLAATSQRPHSDLTATSQRPHSDLTATPPRPHSDLTLGLFISPLIH